MGTRMHVFDFLSQHFLFDICTERIFSHVLKVRSSSLLNFYSLYSSWSKIMRTPFVCISSVIQVHTQNIHLEVSRAFRRDIIVMTSVSKILPSNCQLIHSSIASCCHKQVHNSTRSRHIYEYMFPDIVPKTLDFGARSALLAKTYYY